MMTSHRPHKATNWADQDARRQKKRQTNQDFFAKLYPDEFRWLSNEAGSFSFAANILDAVRQYGDLTERQLETVRRLMKQRDERIAAAKAREESAPTVEIDALMASFDKAKEKGLKHPKMRFDGFSVSPAGATSKNAGALYVKAEDGTYLGKIMGVKLIPSRDCSDEVRDEVARVIQDPAAAAIAYGKRTGRCSICGQELTNQTSIDRGIGPICYGKYF